jgi:hypothetical protein
VQARVASSKPGREDEEEEGKSFFRLPNVRVAHLPKPVAMVTAADISHGAECLIYYNLFFFLKPHFVTSYCGLLVVTSH